MSLAELTALVPLPPTPVGIADRDAWDRVQAHFQTRLPDDLRDIGLTFGSGAFQDVDRLGLWIFNPFSPTYADTVETRRTTWRR